MGGRLGNSDHDIISFHLYEEDDGQSKVVKVRNYFRANYEMMRTEMATMRWDEMLADKDVNGMWNEIKNVLNELAEKYVPWRETKRRNNPKWFNKEMAKQIVKKRRAWNKWKRTKSGVDKNEYKKMEKSVKRMIKNKKNGLERKIAKESKTNPKAYYSYINSSKKVRSKIGPLKSDEGEMIADPKRQADILNDFYASVFTQSTVNAPGKERIKEGIKETDDVDVSEECIKNVIQGLKENSAPGPDGFPNKLIKELKNELAKPLSMLFRKSMDEGEIPDEWRDAHVTPIFKKGIKAEPGNYRPVNQTSGFCKVFEKRVKEVMDVHTDENCIINKSQHGFRKGRSPQTNLIEFSEKTTQWNDEGRAIDVVYFDFSKAFDKVCHKRLMIKLEAIGITGKLLDWIENWLARRRQRVVVEGEFSEWRRVLSSVLQGSVLGGTLFNIFIDDIDEFVKSLMRKFADDTKIARIVECEEDARELQEDIDRMTAWATKWEMEFNVKKCKIIHIGKRNKRFTYKINENEIEVTEEEKDLGVMMTDDLKPTRQCEKAAANAHAALGMMNKAFHYRSKATLIPLYKTFVRTKMEFAVAAWNPWNEGDIALLENVQKRMIRMVSDVRGETYEEKLADAGLLSLKERRQRGDMIEVFKTMRGFNKVERREWFVIREEEEVRATRSNTTVTDGVERRRPDVLFQTRAKKEIRKNFFTMRVVQPWNEIPDEIKNQKSVNAFKNSYDRWKKEQREQRH